MSKEIEKIETLIEVGRRAVEAEWTRHVAKVAKYQLCDAVALYKVNNGIDGFIEHGTQDWHELAEAVQHEREEYDEAKRIAYNAKRRLKTSIRKYIR